MGNARLFVARSRTPGHRNSIVAGVVGRPAGSAAARSHCRRHFPLARRIVRATRRAGHNEANLCLPGDAVRQRLRWSAINSIDPKRAEFDVSLGLIAAMKTEPKLLVIFE